MSVRPQALVWIGCMAVACFGVGCTAVDTRHHVMVSVQEQKMVLMERGEVVAEYPVSTSKYGVGDRKNSYQTPAGRMVIAKKVGDTLPKGAVLKSRQWTGEVLEPDAPGRDPVLTRVLWLRGREQRNRNAYSRLIYIHGTTEERFIGRPVSYGCVRMKSHDVLDLYGRVGVGTPVTVYEGKLPMAVGSAKMQAGWKQAVAQTRRALAMSGEGPAVDDSAPLAAEAAGPPVPERPVRVERKERSGPGSVALEGKADEAGKQPDHPKSGNEGGAKPAGTGEAPGVAGSKDVPEAEGVVPAGESGEEGGAVVEATGDPG